MQSKAVSTPTETFPIASLPLPNALAFRIDEVRRMGFDVIQTFGVFHGYAG